MEDHVFNGILLTVAQWFGRHVSAWRVYKLLPSRMDHALDQGRPRESWIPDANHRGCTMGTWTSKATACQFPRGTDVLNKLLPSYAATSTWPMEASASTTNVQDLLKCYTSSLTKVGDSQCSMAIPTEVLQQQLASTRNGSTYGDSPCEPSTSNPHQSTRAPESQTPPPPRPYTPCTTVMPSVHTAPPSTYLSTTPPNPDHPSDTSLAFMRAFSIVLLANVPCSEVMYA